MSRRVSDAPGLLPSSPPAAAAEDGGGWSPRGGQGLESELVSESERASCFERRDLGVTRAVDYRVHQQQQHRSYFLLNSPEYPLPGGVFLRCDHGLDFTSAYVRIQSINQSSRISPPQWGQGFASRKRHVFAGVESLFARKRRGHTFSHPCRETWHARPRGLAGKETQAVRQVILVGRTASWSYCYWRSRLARQT